MALSPDASPSEIALQRALAGEYSLERELGRGGMGVVYLARDVQLDRNVAIKVLPPHWAAAPAARERFVREAKLAAGLSHPHIVPIHRVGSAGGFDFFVMSYVQGETLGERLRRDGPLPADDVQRILREVAWALAYAHGRGVVHRDVKPDNILLEAESGRALVTDFGIAQRHADAGFDAQTAGTRHFMSPEQTSGSGSDGRSDLFALGVVGFLAVSGRFPPDVSSEAARTVSVLDVAPGLPSALASAIDACLERDLSRRISSGEALAAALAPPPPRSELPAPLRAWLDARNPLLVPYMGWMAGFGTLTTVNLVVWLAGQRPDGPGDIAVLAAIAALPLLPIVGFHLNHGHRLFAAGFSLADLRAALEVARRERDAMAAHEQRRPEPGWHRPLRVATLASGAWLAVTFALVLLDIIHENRGQAVWVMSPVMATLVLSAASNALDVRFVPRRLKRWWQEGVRERLWSSRIGQWFARRSGAPERSRQMDDGAFRATELQLGQAAGELFDALPTAFREHLRDLPALVQVLEARAAEARADLATVAALAAPGDDAAMLAGRRTSARRHLADSVAALEGIRLDLLRLHAGATDLAPLTTVMDGARRIGDDVQRLVEAQHEVEQVIAEDAER